MTLEEYTIKYRKNGMAPGDSFKRKNPYTEAQLETRYNKYMSKRTEDGKTEQQVLREKAIKRDKNECQFCKLLSPRNKTRLNYENRMIGAIGLDMCHVFEKSSYPKLKNDLENVTMLKRIVHNRLDEQKDPETGKLVAKEIIDAYWEAIVGADRYWNLQVKAGIF